MINQHQQTKYFILSNTGTVLTANSTLYNSTTGAVNLAVGAGAFFRPVAGSGNHNEINSAPGAAMQFIQRRDTSRDRSPLYTRQWEQSDWINAFCRNGIIISAVQAAFGTNDSHLIGNPSATANQIVPESLMTYSIQVSSHGDRTDWYNSSYNTPTTFGYYTTPDFTLGTLTEAQQRDTVVANLALDFNNKSRDMSFVIAIDSAGGNTTGSVLISDLGDGTQAVGSSIVIGYDVLGQPHDFILTTEMAQSFAALDTRLTALGFATARLKPYVISAGLNNVPVGTPVAGTTNICDMFYFMAVDEGLATYDYRVATKRRIEVGLTGGLDNVPQERISKAFEGQGYPHQLDIQYRYHNRYEETHRARMPYNSYYLEFANFMRDDGYYDYFVVDHCDNRTASSGMPSFNNFTTIIAVLNTTIGDATSNPYFGQAIPLAQKNYVQASLNSFNTANSLGQPTLAI